MRPQKSAIEDFDACMGSIAASVLLGGRMPQTALRCDWTRAAKRSRTPLPGDRSRFDRPGFRTSPPRPGKGSGKRASRPARAGSSPSLFPVYPRSLSLMALVAADTGLFLLGYRPESPYGPPVSARLPAHARSTRPGAWLGGLLRKPSGPKPASQHRRDRHGRSALGHAWRRR